MFGGALADLQLTQAALGDMATEIDAAALLTVPRRVAARRRRARADDARGGDGEARRDRGRAAVIDRAVQLHGGRGVRVGRDGRAAVPRDPRAAHLRRRDRGAAADRRSRRARAWRSSGRRRGMTRHRARRHVRTRPLAAAARCGPSWSSTCPSSRYPDAAQLRDRAARRGAIARGDGDRVAIRSPGGVAWTYRELAARANRIAHRARRRPGPRAGQPRAAARPQQRR